MSYGERPDYYTNLYNSEIDKKTAELKTEYEKKLMDQAIFYVNSSEIKPSTDGKDDRKEMNEAQRKEAIEKRYQDSLILRPFTVSQEQKDQMKLDVDFDLHNKKIVAKNRFKKYEARATESKNFLEVGTTSSNLFNLQSPTQTFGNANGGNLFGNNQAKPYTQ